MRPHPAAMFQAVQYIQVRGSKRRRRASSSSEVVQWSWTLKSKLLYRYQLFRNDEILSRIKATARSRSRCRNDPQRTGPTPNAVPRRNHSCYTNRRSAAFVPSLVRDWELLRAYLSTFITELVSTNYQVSTAVPNSQDIYLHDIAPTPEEISIMMNRVQSAGNWLPGLEFTFVAKGTMSKSAKSA